MQCIKCNHQFEVPAKFCPECGTKQPEEKKSEGNGTGNVIGDKNVISTSGGDITGTKITGGNVNIHHHAQDDTKKVIQCAVSGRRILLSESISCPICKNDVGNDCFNNKSNRCHNCDNVARAEFSTIVREFLSDGRLDNAELKEMKEQQKRLLLSDEDVKNIEKEERERYNYLTSTNISKSELNDLELIKSSFETKKTTIGREEIINLLFLKHADNPEISFYYFLNFFEKDSLSVYKYLSNIQHDNFFAYFFGILSTIEAKEKAITQKLISETASKFGDVSPLLDVLKTFIISKNYDSSDAVFIEKQMQLHLAVNLTEELTHDIYRSAFVGILGIINYNSCNNKLAREIGKGADGVSNAFTFYFVKKREDYLESLRRQAEEEKMALRDKEEREIKAQQASKLAEEKRRKEEEDRKREELEEKKRREQERLEEKKRQENRELEEQKRQEREEKRERRKNRLESIWAFINANKIRKWVFIYVPLLYLSSFISLYITNNPEIINHLFESKQKGKGSEISLELEKIEDSIRLAIQNGEKEKALELTNKLVHPLHERDHVSYQYYDEEWTKKRQNYKNQIIDMNDAPKAAITIQSQAPLKIDKPIVHNSIDSTPLIENDTSVHQ